ncbi:MAG TPA: TlpA disulfide reductase family protein [Candidatus Polarisedimenticolia bacterium]|nr:TlpA disulfide reductase family protein [Candidatus Polarisedimenticolia bacterium]
MKTPRRTAALAAALLLAAASGCGRTGAAHDDAGPPGRPAHRAIPGPPAPSIDLADASGGRVTLEQFRGRPVIVNFWATWCGPCRRELPSLIRLHEAMAASGLTILAVSIDADRAEVERFLAGSPLPMPVLLDTAHQAADRYRVVTVPSSFVVDASGRVVERIDGEADWTNRELLTTLESLLDAARAPGAKAKDAA